MIVKVALVLTIGHLSLQKVATVIIPNRAVFEAKRQAVVAGGIQKLQIVSDFDRTITAFHDTHGTVCTADISLQCVHAASAQASKA